MPAKCVSKQCRAYDLIIHGLSAAPSAAVSDQVIRIALASAKISPTRCAVKDGCVDVPRP